MVLMEIRFGPTTHDGSKVVEVIHNLKPSRWQELPKSRLNKFTSNVDACVSSVSVLIL